MPCHGCSSVKSGTAPPGCRSNGHCLSGGCNRLNTYDWLSGMLVFPGFTTPPFAEISFKNGARKGFYRDDDGLHLEKGMLVAVESMVGHDIGEVSLTGELARIQMQRKKVRPDSKDVRKIYRVANQNDIRKWQEARNEEQKTLVRARAIAASRKLEMKIEDVECQGDKRKIIFYFTADGRIDFRELVRLYAQEFRAKIEMQQIGLRPAAGRVGGVGSCGRELCCSTWLTEFKTVSTSAARYQNLAINTERLSGQCGRLKCCLNYELDTYLDAAKDIPQDIEKLLTAKGEAVLQKTDILRKVMHFAYADGSGSHVLPIRAVREIAALNAEGKKPPGLDEWDQAKQKAEKAESKLHVVGFVDEKKLGRRHKKNRR